MNVPPSFKIDCWHCHRKGRLWMRERADGAFVPCIPRNWQVMVPIGRIVFRCSVCRAEQPSKGKRKS